MDARATYTALSTARTLQRSPDLSQMIPRVTVYACTLALHCPGVAPREGSAEERSLCGAPIHKREVPLSAIWRGTPCAKSSDWSILGLPLAPMRALAAGFPRPRCSCVTLCPLRTCEAIATSIDSQSQQLYIRLLPPAIPRCLFSGASDSIAFAAFGRQ